MRTEYNTARGFGTYFGERWPAGVCEDGIQVPTPVGEPCELCGEDVEPGDQGSFIGAMRGEEGQWVTHLGPAHRECSLREVLGGIGHLQNHVYWCSEMHDPNGGRTRRQSALEVWEWVREHGV
jgi:hypothetical protein